MGLRKKRTVEIKIIPHRKRRLQKRKSGLFSLGLVSWKDVGAGKGWGRPQKGDGGNEQYGAEVIKRYDQNEQKK